MVLSIDFNLVYYLESSDIDYIIREHLDGKYNLKTISIIINSVKNNYFLLKCLVNNNLVPALYSCNDIDINDINKCLKYINDKTYDIHENYNDDDIQEAVKILTNLIKLDEKMSSTDKDYHFSIYIIYT